MDLPAEIRDEIYLLCFQADPLVHFSRPKSPIESRIRKFIPSRSNTPSSTKHGLLLVNRSIYEGYKKVADRAAIPVFHITTFLDQTGHMSGKAYWVTRPRMKEWLTSCCIHIDLAHCKGLALYHVNQEIKSDFASFIWEYEKLNSVTLTIDSSACGKSGVTSLVEALNATKFSVFVTLLQHRPLETLCIRNDRAVQWHTRVGNQNGWWVKEWACSHNIDDNRYFGMDECFDSRRKSGKTTWYCEDLHYLKENLCDEKCDEQRERLDVNAARLNWLLDCRDVAD
jgi:hypothetical protein